MQRVGNYLLSLLDFFHYVWGNARLLLKLLYSSRKEWGDEWLESFSSSKPNSADFMSQTLHVKYKVVKAMKVKVTVTQYVQLFATPWTIQSMEFSRSEYWSGEPFSSTGDLPNPDIKPRSPALQVDTLPASLKGSPRILEWVAHAFSRGPSQPRNRTRVFCIAGGFFTNWAIREAVKAMGVS